MNSKYALILLLFLAVSCGSVSNTTQTHTQHQIQLKEPVRCNAVTLRHTQCKRTTYDNDSLCWQHKDK